MTADQEFKVTLKRLRSINGTMDASARMSVMRALMDQIARARSYGEPPEQTSLVRLAAHAVVWADEVAKAEAA